MGLRRGLLPPGPPPQKKSISGAGRQRRLVRGVRGAVAPPRSSGGSGGRQPRGQAQETRRKRYYPFVATISASVDQVARV
eukprot:839143-Alexandrium_andersonii.AAC.1